VDAERNVALEAAFAELGGLYTAARNFAALGDAAEDELLPRLTALSARLRALHRGSGITQEDIDAASSEIIDLRRKWQTALREVRQSEVYVRACRAFQADDQAALADLIPHLFAGVTRAKPPASAYFGVSTEVRRRGPGTSPFLSAAACAEKIESILRDGLVPRAESNDWWATDLPSLQFVAAFADLDMPFAVSLPGERLGAAVFDSDVEFGYRLFTPRLRGPFAVEIAAAVDDEWWQAFEQPYEDFREQLRTELSGRGIRHSVVDNV
jgi:hypothetical protein